MEFCRNKLLSAVALVSGLGLMAATAHAEKGVSITELDAWPALRMSDLVARTLVPGAKLAPTPSDVARPSTPGVALGAILQAAPESVTDLIARANGRQQRAAASVATVAAAPAAPAETVVQVTIPSEGGEAVAKLTSAKDVEKFVPSAASAFKEDTNELVIMAAGGHISLTPKSLSFSKTGETARLKVVGAGLEGLTLFVRDQQVLELKQSAGELVARGKGVTELYAVVGGTMYIVPVTVIGAPKGTDLQVPDALVSLEGVFQGSLQSALYPGLEQASQLPQAKNDATGQNAPSLNDSLAETARSVMREDAEMDQYYASADKLAYKAVTVQVVDERSVPEAGAIYPVSGAQIHLVGTEFTGQADATGHLTIRDMPARSRFFAVIDDPNGQVRPAIAELRTGDEGQSGVIRIKAMRNVTFDALTEVAQAPQRADLGSYCGSVVDRGQQGAATAGVSVQIDVAAEGPFYFNSYGFLDRTLNATGANGRFCYFNVLPGPMALTIYQDQALVATLPVSSFTGRHVEETLVLNAEVKLTTRLATMGSAHEQLGSDLRLANSYKTIDAIDLIPLGTEDPMMQLGFGVLQTSGEMLPRGGRLWTYAQASEFEPTVYSYAATAGNQVTPLIPRGFVEDMSLYAQVTYNPELGTLLVEYGTPASVSGEGISMKLVDAEDRSVGDGWYFADAPTTKAIFFNVPAGAYSLLVETNDGYWLGSDTVIVYNETVSYVRMGNALRYRP